MSTGGPTADTRGILNLSIQYWTSRGWALVDVNYGGSTGTSILNLFLNIFFLNFQSICSLCLCLGENCKGYGREYRERLLGHWGIVDVDDCCSYANFLVNRNYSVLLQMIGTSMKL